MKRRALAIAAIAAVLPIAAVFNAPPAAAANCSYPATSSPYYMRISPATVPTVIRHGSSITVGVRLLKGDLLCGGKHLYLYVHGIKDYTNGVATYHLSRTGTTDSNGLVKWAYTNQQNDFRFYARLEGTSVTSPRGLIQVRG